MSRRRISARDRETILNREFGVCHMCQMLIEVGQAWEASHRIPLACGGADDMSNLSPAHKKCHREHTAKVDAPLIAKTRRQHQNHIGASRPAGTIRSPGFAKPAEKDRVTTKAIARRPFYEDVR